MSTLVERYQALFLLHAPLRHAVMEPPGAARKYRTVHQPLTSGLIRAHLAGGITLAAPLIDDDERGYFAAVDIDADRELQLQRLLMIAQWRGISAFAIVCPGSGGHYGGHLWMRFDQLVPAQRLRALIDQMAAGIGLTVESYPTKKALRLPFGVHTHSRRRGQLLLQGVAPLDLDQGGNETIAEAITLVEALPANPVALLPDVKLAAETPVLPSPIRRLAEGDVVVAYNTATDLLQLLEQAGGRVVERYHNGGALLHCPCGLHAHGDARASLEVQPATNTARYGAYIAYGYAPTCAFYTARGQVIDSFRVYCHVHRLSRKDAIERLRAERIAA